MQLVVDDIGGLKTLLGNAPGLTLRGTQRGKAPRGEDLTQAMNIESMIPGPEEAQFEYLSNLLKKKKTDLTVEELRIKTQWNRLRVKILI